MKTSMITFITFSVLLLCNPLLGQHKVGEIPIIDPGSGSFYITGGANHEHDSIQVYYHRPQSFTMNSRILIVVPGSGRNGDDYRDSWIRASEDHSVLILAPSYPEKAYNYGDYHLGGVVKNLDLRKGITFKENSNQVLMDESLVRFNVHSTENEWIFKDFDNLFEIVIKATGSSQHTYDMFGHSAGGQIIHRYALLYPHSKADRLLASNAGTYTLPDFVTSYPFGLKHTGVGKRALKRAFRKKLILFLGALDDENETRGLILRSVTADKQGASRITRGENFYKVSRALAEQLKLKFDWSLKVVPGIGHDQKKMAAAAANYLYGD